MTVAEAVVGPDDVAEFRARALIEMRDTCEIKVPTDPDAPRGDMDPDTLQYDDVPLTTIYGPDIAPHHGACRFQIKADINSNIVETTAGEREATYTTSQLQLPVDDTPDIPVDSQVTALTSVYNPTLVGREFNVHGEIGFKSLPVIRRFRLREVVG